MKRARNRTPSPGERRQIAALFLGGHPNPAIDGHLKTGQRGALRT
jgi:hypothetical protein